MIEQCLQKNPADRPTAKQLLKHDFFKKAKDRSYIAKHLALKFQDRKKMEEKQLIDVNHQLHVLYVLVIVENGHLVVVLKMKVQVEMIQQSMIKEIN